MRYLIGVAAAILGAGLVLWGGIKESKDQHDAARDLGLSFFEVAVAVAIIEKLIDRSEKTAEANRMAWNALEELDHAVWVWLGGQRKLNFAELRHLLDRVEAETIPYFTENLMLRLGSRASHTLVLREEITRLNADLKLGLAALEPLAGLRDGQVLSTKKIAAALSLGADYLSKALKVRDRGFEPNANIEAAVEFQFWRHFGQWPNKYDLDRIEEARRRAPRTGSGDLGEPIPD